MPLTKATLLRALIYAAVLFLTPFADKVVPLLYNNQWPTPQVLVACAIVGIIAALVGIRAYFDGSAERARLEAEPPEPTALDAEQRRLQAREAARSKLPVWLIGFAVLSLGLSACMTIPKATVTLTKVVDGAMKDWANASAAGQTTPELDAKIIKAHDEYRRICGQLASVLEAAQLSGDTATTASVLKQLRAAVDPLMNLIVPTLTPTQATQLNRQLERVNAP